MKMRVLLNTEVVVPPLTGIGYYTLFLQQALQSHAEVELVPWRGPMGVRSGLVVAKRIPGLLNRLRQCPGLPAVWQWCRRRAFARMSRHQPIGTLYHDPGGLLFPYNGPAVTTIHDLSPLHHPEFHPADRARRFASELPETIRRCRLVLTVSEHSRQDIIQTLGVTPDKVLVIPPGIDHAIFRPQTAERVKAVADKYLLRPNGYILSIATLEPRKNLNGLLEAYAMLPLEMRQHYPLVLAGAIGWQAEALQRKIAAYSEIYGQVYYLGYVPQDELPALYSGAAVLAFPALDEGFGLPPLEAMACGCPVAANYSGALPETLGEGAVFAKDTGAMAMALQSLIEDELLRKRCIAAGKARAGLFTWERTAKETVEAYKKALGLAP